VCDRLRVRGFARAAIRMEIPVAMFVIGRSYAMIGEEKKGRG
jgi:hypothetical protein